MSDENSDGPVVEVIGGSPTPEELAAIVTVVTAAVSSGGPADAPRTADRPRMGGWKSYTRTLRGTAFPGPGAWRHIDR
ncbi:MAG: acyl-CoA carboxylase subunit epsilon [Propionibacteriaceae bacterium]|nr:acyl-CoA carboxylase subunit epsilon [Propionibacteriaceae bacterium]